ncbi:hypothetical protein ACKGJY_14125 [Hyunsoonleella sp. 2307UL5-6]|uniref:hypothetical protein n=1 Tax=Hyunsoonleella sp. 2307UL5-6 TaxID=3384768 RepID=UPI0039BD418D
MKYAKFFPYVYLVFGALFLVDAISKYTANGEIAYPSVLLGITAIFMFFFRRKFMKKFDKRDQ